MGMSSHIQGFIPPDDTWNKMLAVYVHCVDAGVDVPDKVNKFFDWEDPRELLGKEVDLVKQGCAKAFHADMKDGFTIDLSKLPPQVKFIRFYNSY